LCSIHAPRQLQILINRRNYYASEASIYSAKGACLDGRQGTRQVDRGRESREEVSEQTSLLFSGI